MHEWEQFLVMLLYLHETSIPAAPVPYSIKSLAFNLLGCNFLVPKYGHCSENQLVLGPGCFICCPAHIIDIIHIIVKIDKFTTQYIAYLQNNSMKMKLNI